LTHSVEFANTRLSRGCRVVILVAVVNPIYCCSSSSGLRSVDFNGLLLDNGFVCTLQRGYYPHSGLVSEKLCFRHTNGHIRIHMHSPIAQARLDRLIGQRKRSHLLLTKLRSSKRISFCLGLVLNTSKLISCRRRTRGTKSCCTERRTSSVTGASTTTVQFIMLSVRFCRAKLTRRCDDRPGVHDEISQIMGQSSREKYAYFWIT